ASVTAGIGLGLATLLSGPFYAAAGTKAYLAMALLAGLGALASYALTRKPIS
ncbi:MAG: MFS transporter, partial [Proteobacteria bacterium]|nr:MFS transporter [Pseudomonadota bacterium]